MIPLYTPSEFEAAFSRDLMPLRCEQCNETFHASKNQLQHRPRHTCSKTCQNARQRVASIACVCAHCEVQFTRTASEVSRARRKGNNTLYCSRGCAIKRRLAEKGSPNIAKIRTCVQCGDPYSTGKGHQNRVRCASCTMDKSLPNAFESLSIAEVEMTNRSRLGKDKYARIRQHARQIHRHLTSLPCAHCGYGKHVEMCHMKPISDWPKTTLVRVVNAPSNIVQLCPNCHWEFDNGVLDLTATTPQALSPV